MKFANIATEIRALWPDLFYFRNHASDLAWDVFEDAARQWMKDRNIALGECSWDTHFDEMRSEAIEAAEALGL